MPQPNDANAKRIVVTGDVTIDWFEVPAPPVAPQRDEAATMYNWQTYDGTRSFAKPGGAMLLADFVRSATGMEVLAPVLQEQPENIPPREVVHSIASVGEFPYTTAKEDEKTKVYRVKDYKGFAGPITGGPTCLPVTDDASEPETVALDDEGNGFRHSNVVWPTVLEDDPQPEILILDDAGNGFRDTETLWRTLLEKAKEPLFVVKMGRPVAQGPLWKAVQRDHAERMVVVVNADDLRRAGVQISRRLSWERTARDFVWQMACNPNLVALNDCASLVVRFGVDGAIPFTRRGGVIEARLFFDPKVGEDGFGDMYPGKMPGVTSAFVAAITAQMAQH